MWKTPVKRAIITSDGDKGYLPIKKDITNKTTSKIAIMVIIGMVLIFFRFISFPFLK
jgi:hypothetical protein